MVVAFVILALFGLASLGYTTMRTNLRALQQLNQENLGWSTSQLQLELDRFRRSLAQFAAGIDGITHVNVSNRFDVLWSRVALTQSGSVGERLREIDSTAQTIPMLIETLESNEQAILDLAPGDLAAAIELSTVFQALDLPVRDFARRVFIGESQATGDVRDKLRQSTLFTAIVTLMAFFISGVALFFVNRESQTNREIAAKNLSLARAAEAANATKLRFLTMMSHELRTPMNGVLGMLALAKQRGLAEPQHRIIEQAEKSGRQMISMLSDILDYSALQDEKMVLENHPFEPRKLAGAIEELFTSVASREGIDFTVSCDPSCPEHVTGDMRRMRQIVAHFASYIVDTAGTSDIRINVGHDDKDLAVTISFSYGKAGTSDEGWKPEILLGARDSEDVESFASDSLGPAVARGILERMGGRVWLDYSNDDRIAIILRAPSPALRSGKVCVHVAAQSESLKAICRMTLSSDEVVFDDDIAAEPVLVVLFETGGERELPRLSNIRDDFPNARFIALGHPISADGFEAIVPIPLNIELLREVVLQRAAGTANKFASKA